MAWHLANWYMVRKLLELQNLLIDILAELVHDYERVWRALLHWAAQGVAVTLAWDMSCRKAGTDADLPVGLAVGAPQTDLARFVARLLGRDDNALNNNESLHLIRGELTNLQWLGGSEAALEVDVIGQHELDNRSFLWQIISILLDHLEIQFLERTLAHWQVG
jgi:hypothetical protein